MDLYIDTCVLPRCALEETAGYRVRCGKELGFELLPMFDLPDFENNLIQNLGILSEGPLIFHEPVWGVEHTSDKGSPAYEESMYHLNLTGKYAEILHPTHLIFHINNCTVTREHRERMLANALSSLEDMRFRFRDQEILIENSGVRANHTMLLDQDEFTELCTEQDLKVLIDVGHAHANGWDLEQLIGSLKSRICGFHLHNNDGQHDLHNRIREGTLDFGRLMRYIGRTVPDAFRVIEYTRPEYNGEPIWEDIEYMQQEYYREKERHSHVGSGK